MSKKIRNGSLGIGVMLMVIMLSLGKEEVAKLIGVIIIIVSILLLIINVFEDKN